MGVERPLQVEWDCQNTIHWEGSFLIVQHVVRQELVNLLQSFIRPLGQ